MSLDSETEETEARARLADQEVVDRRRPGRLQSVSPGLIAILRHPTVLDDPSGKVPDLGATRGIILGILLAVPLWAIIVVGILWAVR